MRYVISLYMQELEISLETLMKQKMLAFKFYMVQGLLGRTTSSVPLPDRCHSAMPGWLDLTNKAKVRNS